MNKVTKILFFLYISLIQLVAQTNLVPNPSFEEFSECPDDEGQINRVLGWKTVSNGTPDYYNFCSTDPFGGASLPTHRRYYTKFPNSGEAIAGIYTNFFPPNIIDQKEFICTKLVKKLKTNKKYYIEFFTSSRNGIEDIKIPCYIDKIGVSLSQNLIFENTEMGQPISKEKYLGNEKSLIDNVDEWTRVSGCVIGDGEEYLTIGNFFTNEKTLVNDECFDYFPNNAYYYIDDVGVFEFDPLPDILYICSGETIKIGQTFLDGTYLWNTGSQDSIIIVNESGEYIVDVFIENCVLSDTVVVINLDDIGIYLPKDTTLCNGGKLNIVISIPGNYIWSNGSSGNTVEINEAGSYYVQIESDCGIFYHSFTVDVERCDCLVWAANVFSPNSDGLNDELIFNIDCQYQYKIHDLKIFDRWGSVVFEQNNAIDGKIKWNGKKKGQDLPIGVYVWVMKYSFINNEQEITTVKSGDVTILY